MSASDQRRAAISDPTPQRVCVIGAGISGLVTTKVMNNDGFDVICFEKKPHIGGVWERSRTYPDLRTNTAREGYAFSDFPYPDTADDFPTAPQVRQYLHDYAEHFGLHEHIHTSMEVTSVERLPEDEGGHSFRISARPVEHQADPQTVEADFVVVCNGVFSVPNTPEIPGLEHFDGLILHSSELTDPAAVTDQSVIVVGAGKSALDCATVAAEHGSSCALVFRKPHWSAPRYLFGLRYDWPFFTRMFEVMYRYHRTSGIESLLHGPGRWLVRAFWRMQSWLVRRLLGIPAPLVPDEPLPGNLDIGIGRKFYDAVRNGRATPIRAEIDHVTEAGTVQLSTGQMLDPDVIVFATGWHQQVDFLAPDLQDAVQTGGRFRLYRHILPPAEPRLGFVGYAQSFLSQLTSEIAAHWLAANFRGDLDLPEREVMEHEIDRVEHWASQTFHPARGGYFIGPHMSHYIDDLMADMDLPRHRTNPIKEYVGRFLPERYAEVGEERRRSSRGHGTTPARSPTELKVS
ncbi:MAG: NAD(P)-binding domain-containing protein [Nitriliruptorales bacterium]|nr:NAD(P)-binding domain-containing protein [Nitriliruptorales bacterium]